MKILAYPAYSNVKQQPYNYLLYSNLSNFNEIIVHEFNLFRLAFHKYDIIHIHWPEYLVKSRFSITSIIKTLIVLLLLFFAKKRKTKLVWTAHNFVPHDYCNYDIEDFFLKKFRTYLSGIIHPSNTGKTEFTSKFPQLSQVPSVVVPLGHYISVYKNVVSPKTARNQIDIPQDAFVITFFGLIRPYKNVDVLITEFIKLNNDKIYLLIVGKPINTSYKDKLLSIINNHPRIIVMFDFVNNDEIQYYFNASDLIVLPFLEIQNSSTALLALSFNKPLLVPNLGALGEIKEIVGDNWIMTYSGDLSYYTVLDAIKWVHLHNDGKPNLDDFNWSAIAHSTLKFYEHLLALE